MSISVDERKRMIDASRTSATKVIVAMEESIGEFVVEVREAYKMGIPVIDLANDASNLNYSIPGLKKFNCVK